MSENSKNHDLSNFTELLGVRARFREFCFDELFEFWIVLRQADTLQSVTVYEYDLHIYFEFICLP